MAVCSAGVRLRCDDMISGLALAFILPTACSTRKVICRHGGSFRSEARSIRHLLVGDGADVSERTALGDQSRRYDILRIP